MAETVATHRNLPLEGAWLALSAFGAYLAYSGLHTLSTCTASANTTCVAYESPWPAIFFGLLGGFLILAGAYLFWTGRRLRRG
jgi:hypothetical protein